MLEPVSAQARAALQEARRAARGLRRNRSDLPGALVELSESLRVLRLHVAAEASLRVPDEIGEAAFRCAQEIVTNALKHGRARNVWLAVERKGAGLELRARDDGEAQGPSAGAGDLRALRERVSELGGSVQARRSEGGFEVSVSIPLEGRA